MGQAQRIVITKYDTLIVEGAGDAEQTNSRINQIKAELETTESIFDREKLQEQLAKLPGAVVINRVGAMTTRSSGRRSIGSKTHTRPPGRSRSRMGCPRTIPRPIHRRIRCTGPPASPWRSCKRWPSSSRRTCKVSSAEGRARRRGGRALPRTHLINTILLPRHALGKFAAFKKASKRHPWCLPNRSDLVLSYL